MKPLILLLLPLSLLAQDAAGELKSGGYIETGYRWNSDLKGNLDTFRSIINRGEGPRLLGVDYTLYEAPKKAWDRLHISAAGWGGEPAAWLTINVDKSKWYRLRVDHRDTAYFNALPSFANPFYDKGVYLNQRAFDTRRKYTDVHLQLRPASNFRPYFQYTRDSGDGRGISVFNSDGNEYPVATTLNDRTHNFRGGAEWQVKNAHFTIEQGGLAIEDNQQLNNAVRNNGNRTTPYFTRQLFLGELLQTYAVSGSSYYSRAVAAWQPTSWLDLSGTFLYSQPKTDIAYNQFNKGLFVNQDTLIFSDQQTLRWAAASAQPHSTGTVTAEVRPFERLRILESYFTDRFHSASTADRLVWNQSQQQTDVIYEVSKWLTVRGGQRYTWGDGSARAPQLGLSPFESGKLRRSTATAGATARVIPKLTLFGDLESARSSSVLFRTSLGNFEKIRARARYELSPSLSLQFNLGVLNNSNPPSQAHFRVHQRQTAVALQWLPKGGQKLKVITEYARTSLRTDIGYVIPQSQQTALSVYSENGHTLSNFIDLALPRKVSLNAGGSLYLSSGTRPTHFYQPQFRLSVPVQKHCRLLAEYRWFSYAQPYFQVEQFQTHQFLVGIRIQQ